MKIVRDGKIDLLQLVEAMLYCEALVREDEGTTHLADAKGMLNKGPSETGLKYARQYLSEFVEILHQSELCGNAAKKLGKVLKAEEDGLHDEAGCKQLVSMLLAELGMLQDREVEETIDDLLDLQEGRKQINAYAFTLFTEEESP